MLQINPKKFKNIENKSIPSPLRPKFRNKAATNDHWNNANFLRIIDFSYSDKVKFTSSNIDKKTKNFMFF